MRSCRRLTAGRTGSTVNPMNDRTILQRLRLFLLVMAGLVFVVTPVELWLNEHYESPVQLIPFLLSALGLIAVLLVLVAPRRETLIGLRSIAVVIILGSLLGMYEHFEANMAFELDIRPGAAASDVLLETLKGASPMLAPGILAFGALLCLAATYHHPALVRSRSDDVVQEGAAQPSL